MDIILVPLLNLLIAVINLYTWAVVVMVFLSWLTAFNVVNGYNRFVFTLSTFLFKITEPPLRLIRKVLPNIGGFDFAPVVLILGLWFLQGVLHQLFIRLFMKL